MGQLRTCNKRHKRAIRVSTAKAEATPSTPPKSEKAAA